jgi:hypothetical protein
MSGNQTTQDSDGRLEDLWLDIGSEGDSVDYVSDGSVKTIPVVENDESIQYIDESKREVPRDIVVGNVPTTRDW